MENEPNKEAVLSVDEIFDKVTAGEQPKESSPSTEQVETPKEDGSDPAKTPSTEETTDKGFASHPAWIEREQKYKEAREALKAEQDKAQKLSRLLDDYKAKAEPKASPQAQSIAEKVCSKLGWDITRLNQEQKEYINDQVNLTQAILEERVGSMLDERLKPMEEMSQEYQMQRQFQKEDIQVRELAKDEFPGVDFDKVVKPAISKYIADLDQKDPERTIKLSYEDIYYRATRSLLREVTESKGRQEVRDGNKANLRPLGKGPATGVSPTPAKPMKPHEFVESVFDKVTGNR